MSPEAICRKSAKHLDALRNTVCRLWVKCCEVDGINPGAKFVAFGTSNKFVPFYNRATCELIRAKAEAASGGYVGLSIVAGKAV